MDDLVLFSTKLDSTEVGLGCVSISTKSTVLLLLILMKDSYLKYAYNWHMFTQVRKRLLFLWFIIEFNYKKVKHIYLLICVYIRDTYRYSMLCKDINFKCGFSYRVSLQDV